MTRNGFEGVTFRIFDRTVAIRTPADAARVVAARLPAYAVTGTDGHERYRLYRERNRWVVELFPPHVDVYTSLDEAAEALEYFVTTHLLTLVADWAQLHAAAAHIGGGAVLVVGESDAGKSSFAFRWSRTGFPVLGDDVVLLAGDGVLHPFKRLFRVKRSIFDAHRVAEPASLRETGDRDEAWYDPARGAGWAAPIPVTLVVHARFQPGAGLGIEPLRRAEVLQLLLASLLPTGLAPGAAFEAVTAVASRARGVAVAYDDPSRAADAVARLTGPIPAAEVA